MSVINVVLTMVRKLHAIVFMFYLPLLHTRQMVLHCRWRRVLLTMRRRKRETEREKTREDMEMGEC